MAFDITGYRIWKVPISYTFGSALTGFVAVITGDVFGPTHDIWTTSQNGGGDLRVALDDGGVTQYPLQVVRWNTTTKLGVLFLRIPTVDTGDYIHVYAKGAGPTQPAVDAAFGRNEAWQDYAFVTHDGVTDSSGNYTITQYNSPTVDAGPLGDDAITFDGVNQYAQAVVSESYNNWPRSYGGWAKNTNADNSGTLIGLTDSTKSTEWETLIHAGSTLHVSRFSYRPAAAVYNADSTGATQTAESGVWNMYGGVQVDAGVRRSYLNGTDEGTEATYVDNSGTYNRIGVGRFSDATPSGYLDGTLWHAWIKNTEVSADEWDAIHANQSPSRTFWGTPVEVTVSSGSAQTVTSVIAEHKAEAVLLDPTMAMPVTSVVAEHKSQASLLNVTQALFNSVVTAEHHAEAQLLSPTQSMALQSIVAEQLAQAELIDVTQAMAISCVVGEHTAEAETLTIEQLSGQIITLVVAEHKNEALTLAISQIQANLVAPAEHKAQAQIIDVTALQPLTVVTGEHLNEALLLSITSSADNTDISGVVLVPVTEVYALSPVNQTQFTLTQTNKTVYALEES